MLHCFEVASRHWREFGVVEDLVNEAVPGTFCDMCTCGWKGEISVKYSVALRETSLTFHAKGLATRGLSHLLVKHCLQSHLFLKFELPSKRRIIFV
jgi:hypothetical protein